MILNSKEHSEQMNSPLVLSLFPQTEKNRIVIQGVIGLYFALDYTLMIQPCRYSTLLKGLWKCRYIVPDSRCGQVGNFGCHQVKLLINAGWYIVLGNQYVIKNCALDESVLFMVQSQSGQIS